MVVAKTPAAWVRRFLQIALCSAFFLEASSLIARPDGDAPNTDIPDTEESIYPIVSLPIPDGIVLEPGALEFMTDGRLAVATRRGDIYILDGAFGDDPTKVKYHLYAQGLHEVLGMARRGEWLYVTQRGEVSRLKDEDGDGSADLFETVSDGWEICGDYHEYAFGSKFDKDGNIWVVLCLTGSFSSNIPFRGWGVKVSENGTFTPVCSGIRSPGGVGMNAAGDVFYSDNQGPWNGTCSIRWLRPGYFMGHPAGNRWFDQAPNLKRPAAEPKSGSRIHKELERIPELMPPAVFLPYGKMGQSTSGIECDLSKGKFGPFEEQLFVGDQTHSTVMRVFLEKVKGYYQGVCFPFRSGFRSGSLSLVQAEDGSIFVGGSARGWGSRGGKPYSLARLVWSGKVPFEVHEMRVRPDGFELTFTEPVDAKAAADLESYNLKTYTYIFQSNYGSPEVDHTTPKITAAEVATDGLSVRLRIDGLQIGHVHELHLPGVRSKAGKPLLHDVAYYTLFFLP